MRPVHTVALFAFVNWVPSSFSGSLAASPTLTATRTNEIEELFIQHSATRLSGVSPEAVTQVYFDDAQLEAADLGQLLNRQQGITVRRTGGLGSNIRFSLNGLTGNQVRFFVDGVPLQLAGLGGSIADIPPGLLGGVAIYRGVVPARLGADALGGAIELQTKAPSIEPQVGASYLVGSFGAHRVSAIAAAPLNDDGLFIRTFGFFDRTDNDFKSEQRVADPNTGAAPQRLVRRFHDGYQAYGASLSGGWYENSKIGTLTFRAFVTGSEKEVQQGLSAFTAGAVGEAERGTFRRAV